MKRTLLLTLAVLSFASMAFAQPSVGNIGVFASEVGDNCNITDAPGLVTAYILHVNATSANSSTFKLTQDPGVNLTFISGTVNPAFLSLGNVTTGITITYVGCKTTFPLTLATLQYLGSGTTTSCGKLTIVPDPTHVSGEVAIVNCSSQTETIGTVAGSAMVNSTGDCGCDIAVEETSWSKIKALYQ